MNITSDINGNSGNETLMTVSTVGNDATMELFQGTTVPTSKIKLHTTGNSYLNGGNVGVGTVSPSEKLHVDGVLSLGEQGSKPTATGNVGKLWVESDNTLRFMDAAGTEYTVNLTAV